MGGESLRSFIAIFVMLSSAFGLGLGWHGVFQDDHYLEHCYQSGWKQACFWPRYKWYDTIYDGFFREKCMMARMADPTSMSGKESQCYSLFHTRSPQCLKLAGQCLLAAVAIGGITVLGSQPLVAERQLEEPELLAQAQAQERTQTASLGDYRPVHALCD